MKKIILITALALTGSLPVVAQTAPAANRPDSIEAQDDTIQDNGEAGGISVADVSTTADDKNDNSWLLPLAGGIVIGAAVASWLILYGSRTKKQEAINTTVDKKQDAATAPAKATGTKTAAELKKIKQEYKSLETQSVSLRQQLNELTTQNANYEKSLAVYRDFDALYFGEAFRKLVAPATEAIERGNTQLLLEQMLKITGHFGSLTRYKISKRQAYDEANIHLLMNQKVQTPAGVTEITADTAPDKIPSNIKALLELLKANGSKGLDDTIIAGYKMKNI
ncbi:MAG: hypothetical protein QM642_07660 [Edaphocola sp.]